MASAILKPFEISEDEIKRLAADELVQLVKRLIEADLQRAGVPLSAVQGTLRINVADGGEDIRVEWEGAAQKTDYIPRTFTVFQLKAENVSDAKLKKEPLEANGKTLKPAVAEAVARHGAYVLITSKTNVTTPKKGPKTPGKGKKKGKKAKKAKPAKKVTRLAEVRGLLKSAITKVDAAGSGVAVDVFGPPKIVDWVNSHPMVAVWVKQLLGIASSDFSFQSSAEWQRYRDHTSDLVAWPVMTEHMQAIQQSLMKPREVVRLLGHSGLGKSRLALEAIKASGQDAGNDLSPIVAYAREYSDELIRQVRDFINCNRRVVLVVDDCSAEGHRRLSYEVHKSGSLLSMITLDLDFEKPPPGDKEIVIDAAPDEVIKGILEKSGVVRSPEDIERATQFCSGFPLVAVLVAAALKDGAEHFADFHDKEHLADKLVWGRGQPDDVLLRCLRCIALFEAVGIADKKAHHLEWVATNLLGITALQLELNFERFYKRRILQKRGYSVLVRPRPLAAQLAATFWKNATNAQRQALLGPTLPDELKQALCERLSDLNYLTDAQSVAAQLCGPSGPFGSAKALNTEIGARCLRNLAEVAPDEVVAALMREFGGWGLARLKGELGPGRRWLVWTLDALSWEPSVFQDTMWLLLRFAASENETWANNSTAEFVQRFRWELPGTSASLADRLKCLKVFVESAEDEELPPLLSALTNAIDPNSGSRTVGSERHGTRKTYEDYQPKFWREVFDYSRGAIELLLQIARRGPNELVMARRALQGIHPNLVLAPDVFDDFAKAVAELRPNGIIWGEMLEKLSFAIKHRLSKKNKEADKQRPKLATLMQSLLPQTLEERVLFFVKSVPWHFEEPADDDDDDPDFERNRKRAEELGRECASNWPVFESVVDQLSQGETRESLAFGRVFFENTDCPDRAIKRTLDALAAAQGNNPNPSLLGGMLHSLAQRSHEQALELLKCIASNTKTQEFVAYFAAFNLTPETLGLVIDALEREELSPKATYLLGMGRVLAPLPLADIKKLIATLMTRGSEGVWAAIDLLGMYVLGDNQKFQDMRGEINAVLRSDIVFTEKPQRTIDSHHYETLAEKLLKDRRYGRPLALHLAQRLIQAATEHRFDNDMLFQRLASLILERFPEAVMRVFAKHIEDADRRDRWFISHILGSPMSFRGKKDGPLFKLTAETILENCRAFPTNFAPMVAEIAPLFSRDSGGNVRQWTDLGRELLNEFGSRKDILSALTINIGTGGWSGPTSEHLRTFVPPLVEMKSHKLATVRAWARERVKQFQAQIAREVKDEEEEAIRNN